MSKKTYLPVLLLAAVSLVFSGCVVRTYEETRQRPDQDLTKGNRGYLMAKNVNISERERKTTRTRQVVEIELRSPIKFDKSKKGKSSLSEGANTQAAPAAYVIEPVETEVAAISEFESYTVQKGDTLQKISKNFYGTTRKWPKIYEANKGILKTPDSIKPGQVLNIPVIAGVEESVARPAHMK